MTSKLVLDNIAGRTTAGSIAVVAEGNGTTTNLQNGLAKATCTFSGAASGATVRASFNQSSTDDDAVGQYGVNFTSPMSSTEFTTVGSNIGDSSSTTRTGGLIASLSVNTASSINFASVETEGSIAYADWTYINTVVHGDLA